jgi:NAD(P)-dependent dehydrogenase (short-subunit alcohol dehydrogenase family)
MVAYAYLAAKAAVVNLLKQAALDLAPTGSSSTRSRWGCFAPISVAIS